MQRAEALLGAAFDQGSLCVKSIIRWLIVSPTLGFVLFCFFFTSDRHTALLEFGVDCVNPTHLVRWACRKRSDSKLCHKPLSFSIMKLNLMCENTATKCSVKSNSLQITCTYFRFFFFFFPKCGISFPTSVRWLLSPSTIKRPLFYRRHLLQPH